MNEKKLHPLLEAYYAELEPEARRRHLEAYASARREADLQAAKVAASDDSGLADDAVSGLDVLLEAAGDTAEAASFGSAQADAYREALFAARHQDKKHPGQPVDRFLWYLMNMSTIYKNPGFFPKRHRKEVLSYLRSMELDNRPRSDAACGDVLYMELRNLVHRYYFTCSDPSYGRSLLGMLPADAGRRAALCCTDIWNFSRGIAEMTGLEEEMALLCQAANDEYCALVPEAESLDAAYRAFNPDSKKR